VRRALVAIGVPALLFLAQSCRAPTEIVLEITNNFACDTPGVQAGTTVIAVGGSFAALTAPSATVASCPVGHPHEVGTLVLVPSGDSDSVAVEVVGGIGAEACDLHTASIHCVVAKRLLRYLPHERETIPVVLDAACAGVDCGDKTCVAGACADPNIDPNDGRAIADSAPSDASVEGGACPLVYAPTSGVVACGNLSCTGLCCYPNRCVINGTQCPNGALRGCDDPVDCKDKGQKCCASADGIAGTDAFCKDSCTGTEVELCSTTCDCATCALGSCGLATCGGTCPGA
jgi:hypothetical protein